MRDMRDFQEASDRARMKREEQSVNLRVTPHHHDYDLFEADTLKGVRDKLPPNSY